MAEIIGSGGSASLSYPGGNYPTSIGGRTSQLRSNAFQLAAGAMFTLPPGEFLVNPGLYGWIQFYDPVIGMWLMDPSTAPNSPKAVRSDGASWRVWNPTGCPVGALVTNVGSSYAAASTTVSPSTGASTWRPIVGGAINTTITIGKDSAGTTGGSNFTYPPQLVIDPPPAGGVPATAYCALSGGAINSITVVDQGAGYTSVPAVTVIPDPLDPNYNSTITIPALTAALTGSGTVTAIVPVAHGTVLTTAPTLTIAGAGASATASAIMCLTVTAAALSNSGGAAYPGTNVNIPTAGGYVTTAAGATVNPRISTGLFVPRPAQIYAPVSGGAIGTAVVLDGGMFQVAPTGNVIATSSASGQLPSTASAATLTMGSAPTTVTIQPL